MNRASRKNAGWLAGAIAVGVVLSCSPMAGAHEEEAEATGPNTGKLAFNLGFDVATKYYFRGILQEDEGFIAQPYGEVGISLYEGNGGLTSATLFGGVWNSVHSEQTGNDGSGPDAWYEADVYGGVKFGFFDTVEFSTVYTAYTSPNGAFSTVQEFAFGLALDDSRWLGDLAMSPSATLAIETDKTAFGPDRGAYFELAGGPEFEVIKSADYPLTVALPLTLGLSLSDYYETETDSDTFGYFDAGLVAGVPLSFIASDYGSWYASAGLHFLTLGDTLRDANEGDDWEFYGLFGVSMTY